MPDSSLRKRLPSLPSPWDFDELVERRGTDCVKWDEYPDTLPMWVADMDFRAAPAIREALARRLAHGVFGYERVPDGYYDDIAAWFSRRHGWNGIRKEDIICTTGVVAAFSAAIKALTRPGDGVILQTPCYNCFFPAVRNNRCTLVENPLLYGDGKFSMDYDSLETKARHAKALLLCNPHNPVGRVWTREELVRLGTICRRHGVFVISDEIHCEITCPGHGYTPYATLPEAISDFSVSCLSPTKGFNLAGIQIANIYVRDPEVRAKIDRAINENECCDVNVFGVAALRAAYQEGDGWLDALNAYLKGNADTVRTFLAEELPEVTAPPLEGTYLMWLDCRRACAAREGEARQGLSDRLAAHLRENVGLALSSGTIYGPQGEGFLRLNIACPRAMLLDGLGRLARGIRSFPRP